MVVLGSRDSSKAKIFPKDCTGCCGQTTERDEKKPELKKKRLKRDAAKGLRDRQNPLTIVRRAFCEANS